MSVAAPSPAPAPKQQLKLKLRQSPASEANTPGARSSATPGASGVIVDNEALLRQQRHVQESMHGQRAARPSSSSKPSTPAANPFSGARGAAATIPPLPAVQSKPAASPPATNGIKHDVQSPALNAIRPASNTSDSQSQRLSVPAHTPHPTMAPPQALSRPASGSPHPNGFLGGPPSASYTNQYHPPPNYYVPPVTTQFDYYRKTPLKSKLTTSLWDRSD
jgi:hypothetical protein